MCFGFQGLAPLAIDFDPFGVGGHGAASSWAAALLESAAVAFFCIQRQIRMSQDEPTASQQDTGDVVPDSVIPRGTLPPLRWRDLPEPVPLLRMIGPGIMLAGLALGSGEFIFWPYITYKSQFIFFWACLLGVTTQYFLNMEITRWTLATGESAITGFCRMSRHWAWVFLILNIVPWIIPAWARGAAEIVSWMIWEPQFDANGSVEGLYVTELAIAGMFLCGIILTAGPVIYETVERIQMVLVGTIMILVVVFAVAVVRTDALTAMAEGTISFEMPPDDAGLDVVFLLGALAFAGAGGTLNLGQSNYIKDKGYGMGKYIGRITSPITGQEESISEVGYHFPDTPENRSRWKTWWRRAGTEHFVSFYLTCLVSLVLLTLISYSIFYDADGAERLDASQYGKKMDFIWGEAVELGKMATFGAATLGLFLVMGIAILLTTEFGVLDGASRISTDLVKVNWLQNRPRWTESRLYYVFLWGTILLGTGVLLLDKIGVEVGTLTLFKFTAAMNGAVMFLYSMTLLRLNCRSLPKYLRMSWWRMLIMIWSVLFFGFFAVRVVWDVTSKIVEDLSTAAL